MPSSAFPAYFCTLNVTSICVARAAYLRYRLRDLRQWVSARPDLNRLEDAQDVPAPRLGRTGLGPIGPRSAHPITPFKVCLAVAQ